MTIPESVLTRLKDAVGAKGFSTETSEIAPHLEEWRSKYRGHSPLLLKPATAAEVSAILAICHETGTPVVTQGGNTGLVGGQIPLHGEVLLSTQKLNRIRALDEEGMTLVAEAGVTLAQVQQAADDKHLLFPLSLASEGSCTIGGNIATNAGGTHVLRYGMTRALVLGLEVVLATGTVLPMLRALHKDNTGYDLKQVFIGSEGSLGIVTAATLRLFPKPEVAVTAFAAVPSPAAAVALLSRMQHASRASAPCSSVGRCCVAWRWRRPVIATRAASGATCWQARASLINAPRSSLRWRCMMSGAMRLAKCSRPARRSVHR